VVACLFITLILSSRSGFLLVFGRVVGKEGISCNIGSFFFLFFFFMLSLGDKKCHWRWCACSLACLTSFGKEMERRKKNEKSEK